MIKRAELDHLLHYTDDAVGTDVRDQVMRWYLGLLSFSTIAIKTLTIKIEHLIGEGHDSCEEQSTGLGSKFTRGYWWGDL